MDKFGVLRAKTFTVRIHCGSIVRKIFKVGFTRSDGSIWIAFPYFKESHGVAGLVSHPPVPEPTELRLGEVGRVTSHRVKYSHHPDGRALFSQDGRVVSEIRKPSVPLSVSEGHLCTVQVNGLADFAEDPAGKPDVWTTTGRLAAASHTITFEAPWEDSPAMQFVIHCYNERKLRPLMHYGSPDPIVNIVNSDSSQRGVLVSAPKDSPGEATYLVIKAARTPEFTSAGRPCLVFIGGFDPPEMARDPTRESSLLALAYPIDKYEELRTAIGSIDLG